METDRQTAELRQAHERSDTDAVRLAQLGDSSAFEQLYKTHNGRVLGLCLRMMRNRSEAEDTTQEVFLQVFRKIHTFRGESSFSAWLYRLTVNTVLMKIRKERHSNAEISICNDGERSEQGCPAVEPGGPDSQLEGLLDRMNLSKAIDELARGYRTIFILHDIEGYEHHEIAEILGCSIGNCKSQLFKARLRLRRALRSLLRGSTSEAKKLNRYPSVRTRLDLEQAV